MVVGAREELSIQFPAVDDAQQTALGAAFLEPEVFELEFNELIGVGDDVEAADFIIASGRSVGVQALLRFHENAFWETNNGAGC